MVMQIKEILKSKGTHVWSIGQNATLHEALRILVNHKIGALLVFAENGEIAGILSERDILRECERQPQNWATREVGEAMTQKLIVATPEDSVEYIMGIMTQNRVRHIPVVCEGKLEGIVSIGDVVKAQLKDSQYENKYLKEYIASR